MNFPRHAAFLLIALAVSGCQSLPIDGPLQSDVESEVQRHQRTPFRLVELQPDMVPLLQNDNPVREQFMKDLGATSPILGPGDTISVTLVEPSAGGLYSGPASITATAVEPGARVVQLPPMTLDPQGRIDVPFASQISLLGLTDTQAAAKIRGELSGQAIGIQVLVNTSHSVANNVTVSGNVKNPGVLPMEATGERLLDMIARAGGTTEPLQNVVIQVNRFGTAHRVRMTTLLEDPETNIHVRSGDYIHLLLQPRTYLVMGATQKVDERNLGLDALPLSSALASAGGLLDSRANANAVMLLRYETPEVMRRISAIEAKLARQRGETAPIPPDTASRTANEAPVPVVFTINMRSATGLFMAQALPMRERDLIYVPNSSYTQYQKMLDLVRVTISPATESLRASAVGNTAF